MYPHTAQLLQVCTDFIIAVNSVIQALLWSKPCRVATAGHEVMVVGEATAVAGSIELECLSTMQTVLQGWF